MSKRNSDASERSLRQRRFVDGVFPPDGVPLVSAVNCALLTAALCILLFLWPFEEVRWAAVGVASLVYAAAILTRALKAMTGSMAKTPVGSDLSLMWIERLLFLAPLVGLLLLAVFDGLR